MSGRAPDRALPETLAKTDVYALKAPHACGAFTYRLLRSTADFTKGYRAHVDDCPGGHRAVRRRPGFIAGLGFVAADVLPFFGSNSDRPMWLNLAGKRRVLTVRRER